MPATLPVSMLVLASSPCGPCHWPRNPWIGEPCVDELFHEIDKWIAEGMFRPKRLKMAKPAALAMAEASAIPLE